MKLSKVIIILLLISSIGLFSEDLIRQGITLEEGWNLISLNVAPEDSLISSVFSELTAGNQLVQIKTEEESWLPDQADNLNTIIEMERGQGYAVRVQGSNTLQISGEYLDISSTVLELNSGWNLGGFHLQSSMPVDGAFATLISSGILEKVQSETESFDPDLPGAFNTLEILEPGEAYWIKVNTDVDFSYPGRGGSGGFVRSRELFPRPWETVFYPSSTIAYCYVTIDGEQAEAGDEVGSFINGECRGVGVVFIMGNNATTFFTIQTMEVEMVSFNVWDASEDEVLEVSYTTFTNPGGDIGYPPNQLPIDATGIVQTSWDPVIYKHSTTMLGRVTINGESAEAGDMIAAYVEGECRGCREVNISEGVAYITLLVQGEIEENIHFKVWDISEDEIFDLENDLMSDPGEVFGYPPDYLSFNYGSIGFGFDLPDEMSFISGESLSIDLSEYIVYPFMNEITASYEGNDQIQVIQDGLQFELSSTYGFSGTEQLHFTIENVISGQVLNDDLTVEVTPTGEVEIISVNDVPDDEGGYVEISFNASFYDDGEYPEEEHYIIHQLINEEWQLAAEVPATGNSVYQVTVSTQSDSTIENTAIESFQIGSVMLEGNWLSEVVMGYSVDNLAPGIPSGLEFTEGYLIWSPVSAEDLAEYQIYLDGEYWQSTEVEQVSMLGIVGSVNIVSIDIHGNESEMTESMYGGFGYGDIDVNLNVDAFDSSLALEYFCGLETGDIVLPWSDWRQQVADVDGNGTIEAYDAGLILRYSVGLIEEFPIEDTGSRNLFRNENKEQR